MARVRFEEVFGQNADGSVEPRRAVNLNGITMGPGVRFSRGVAFVGVDLVKFIGHDLEVEEQNGTLVLKGIYQKSPLQI